MPGISAERNRYPLPYHLKMTMRQRVNSIQAHLSNKCKIGLWTTNSLGQHRSLQVAHRPFRDTHSITYIVFQDHNIHSAELNDKQIRIGQDVVCCPSRYGNRKKPFHYFLTRKLILHARIFPVCGARKHSEVTIFGFESSPEQKCERLELEDENNIYLPKRDQFVFS